jgi:REP element-mobilizing transposase RayT
MPANVTLRIGGDVPNLRSSRRFAAIRECFAAVKDRAGFRLIEFAVLSNHVHLVVEAESSVALSRGVQGLCVRLARTLNRLLARTGAIFADHFHSHLLRSPTEVVNAIRYVLGNATRHYGERGLDGFSSAAPSAKAILALPMTWLVGEASRRMTPPRPSLA